MAQWHHRKDPSRIPLEPFREEYGGICKRFGGVYNSPIAFWHKDREASFLFVFVLVFVLLALRFLKRVLGAMAPQEGPIPVLFGAP